VMDSAAGPGTATTWQECVDPDTGSTYFYSAATGATQWEAPGEFVSSGTKRGRGWTAAAFEDAGGSSAVQMVVNPLGHGHANANDAFT
jgi:hypothetical protein